MNTKKIVLAAMLAGVFLPALAEETAADTDKKVVERRFVHRVQGGPMRIDAPFIVTSHRVVKNAPYSAEAITERQQTLTDGNQISRSTTALSYRDSAGRTRHEVRDDDGEVRSVVINDPVERVTYILHPKDRTATKVSRMGPDREALEAARGSAEAARAAAEAGRTAREAARERIELLRKEGRLPAVERKTTADGEEIVIRRFERIGDAKAGAGAGEQVRMQIGPVLGNALADHKWSQKATTKDLGTREFDGVKAQGKLRSYEIPAGEIGNRHPIVVTDETWTVPELQLTVYSKHSDPRSGEQVYRVQNLKRDEPAAALFTVPSDYTVKDVMANVRRKIEEKKQ